ncbi:MAG: glycosyltransferase family 2 protein [Alphaproteobacteria bacterium]|nr:glycosyltransferase family 2 protein [Alphaproteobacteria bacterium]
MTDAALLDKLTLAIPLYNDARHLRATLESVVGQAGRIWIYDNCSTDGSSDIAAEFAAKYSSITHVLHPENLGAFENFRLPLFACETEYFMFLGAHDLISEEYTLPLLKAVDADPDVAFAISDVHHIDENGGMMKKFTRLSDWHGDLHSDDAYKRLNAFIREHFGPRHDSLIYHGVHRTSILQKAWVHKAFIAGDDAVMTREAALGKIVYAPGAALYARRFTETRKKGKKEAERSASTLAKTGDGVERSRREAVLSIIDMVLHITQRMEDLPAAFRTIRLVERYVVKPSRARRRRRIRQAITGIAVAALAGFAAYSLTIW